MTGGCRRLGAGIAAALAKAGYDLALHASRMAEPEPALAAVLGEWRGFAADFRDPASAPALYDAVRGHFGRPPDLLVNSASIFGQDDLSSVTVDDLRQGFAVNGAAAALLSAAFARDGGGGGGGGGGGDRAIVNILDQRIAHPHGDQLSYTLGKLALAGLTRMGSAVSGVRTNGVAPGLTMPTPDYAPAQLAELAARMPLARLPRPEDVADAVLFLATARGVDGQIVFVDGGASLVPFAGDFLHIA